MILENFKAREAKLLARLPSDMRKSDKEHISRMALELCGGKSGSCTAYLKQLKWLVDNLSNVITSHGTEQYEKGVDVGWKRGREAGLKEGASLDYKRGLEVGRDEGYDQGYHACVMDGGVNDPNT